MKQLKTAVLALGAALAFSSPALADHHSVKGFKSQDTELGKVLANAKGMTLYTFDKDKPGKSNCNGGCATAWPPMLATESAESHGDFSVIKRDDGQPQWAYKGMPLYTWMKDKKAGDVTGDKVKNVWHVVPMGGSSSY